MVCVVYGGVVGVCGVCVCVVYGGVGGGRSFFFRARVKQVTFKNMD